MSAFHTCVKNVNDCDIRIDQEMCTLYIPGTSPSILIFESFRGGGAPLNPTLDLPLLFQKNVFAYT